MFPENLIGFDVRKSKYFDRSHEHPLQGINTTNMINKGNCGNIRKYMASDAGFRNIRFWEW